MIFPRFYALDDDNRPVPMPDLLTWGRWLEGFRRHVAWTQVTSEITVSTIFLGLDHRHSGEGPPILFESMVFGGPLAREMCRYVSWDDAETGHKMIVARCRAAIGQKITEETAP